MGEGTQVANPFQVCQQPGIGEVGFVRALPQSPFMRKKLPKNYLCLLFGKLGKT